MSKVYIIGRDLECDISIDSNSVSKHHLRIVREGEQWYIVDSSTNGTYLNSYNNPITKELLKPNDILYLGTYKLSTNRIIDLINGKRLQDITVNKDEVLIGRDPTSDIPIDHPNISWNHAKIINEDGLYYIYDLNSTNGTFVNDSLVSNKKQITEGDKITLGAYSFIFKSEQNQNQNLSFVVLQEKGFRVEIQDVSFIVKIEDENKKKLNKILLDDISLTIYPGEMVGIMGLSGAGKTTLLKVLSGYIKPTKGKVFINDMDLYKNYNRIKNSIGYVPQDDIIHPELTVYEALFYSSKLRLGSDFSDDEINRRINKVLDDLGLDSSNVFKNTVIGSPDTQKGISGGQRKRVNIAMELLADPEIIFLDEPTSGLSSVDTNVVMDTLKKLSDSGKTVILTIHQPNLENYQKMDTMIILSYGKLAYFGSTYPESIEFFNKDKDSIEVLAHPDKALLGLYEGEKRGRDWQSLYKKSEIYKKFVEERADNRERSSQQNSNKDNSSSIFRQFRVLTSRYLNIKLKDKLNTTILLVQAPIIALLLLFLYGGDEELYKSTPTVLLFIFILSAIWFGVINSVREIVSEKAIYERERLLGLKLIPYIFSKFLVLMVLSLIQVVLLVLIVNHFVPLTLDIFQAIGIIFLTSLSGLGIGLLVSAVSKSASQALALVPIILLPMIIFAGGMIPIKELPTNKFYLDAYRISFLMPTRWTLEELVRIYDKNDVNSKEPIKIVKHDYNATATKLYYEDNATLDENSAECKDENGTDRRCIETLYVLKKNIPNSIYYRYELRNNSSQVIYMVSILYIVLPLLLTILILRRKDKS